MIKQQISEKEIETSASKSKAMRLHGRFLKGPIPMRDINSANRLPGQALSVLLAVHHQTALTRKRWVTLPAGLLTQLGISRDAKARALQQLEAAVLVRVVRAKGKAARVSLGHGSSASQESSIPANHSDQVIWQNADWRVTKTGLSSRTQNYEISVSQLDELRNVSDRIAMWPLQMAEKSWIDIETFIEAFQQAVVVHKLDSLGTLDLAASYARARDIAGNRNPPTKCGVN